jgi:rubrerythrin
MTKQNYLQTKEDLLFHLMMAEGHEIKAAEDYANSAGVLDDEDRDILLGIAEDKKRHADALKQLICSVEENYGKLPDEREPKIGFFKKFSPFENFCYNPSNGE